MAEANANEQLRDKLLSQGAQALSDAELLALFLKTGTGSGANKRTAEETAQQLLDQFGSLRALLRAPKTQFCEVAGLGEARYASLQAVLEMTRRHLKETLQKSEALTNPTATFNYLRLQLRDYPHEVFACLWLDNQHRVITLDKLFRGSITSASVYPREVVKAALHHNAAAVIFAHNHPSGVAEPSQADIDITKELKQALALIDVRVLDHIVVGDGQQTSLAQAGLL